MSPVAVGSDFAGYRLEEVAGEGGMGRVYRATQSGLKRPVALKLIVPALAHDDSFRLRFKRESELAASIEHPNVIPVYEAGEAEGRLFIAMRWVQGTDLRSVIVTEGRLEPARAVGIVEQVAAALDAAHRGGLVHRDVKPANVMLSRTDGKEHVYLTDFGLTKRTTSDTPITKTGAFLGTPDYVPPEQIKGERADARADVYALGCVLFHTLSGRPPFERDSEVAKMYAHLNDPPPRVAEAVPGTPTGLGDVIERGLAKSPPDRYPSAGDLARAARVALHGGEALPEERSLATGPAAPPPTEVMRPKVLPPRERARVPTRPVPPPARPAPAPPPARQAPEPTREGRQPVFEQPWLLLVAGVLVAGAAGLIGRRLGQAITSDGGSWEHAVLTVVRRAEIWGVIGLALGAWLGVVRTRSREAMGVALTGAGVGLLAGALGGLIVAPTDVVDGVKQSPGAKDILQAASLAVEGGLIGALIGRFWRPPSGALGLAAGVAGGVLAFLASDWEIKDSQSFGSVAQVGVQAMVIAACAITALIFLGRRLSR